MDDIRDFCDRDNVVSEALIGVIAMLEDAFFQFLRCSVGSICRTCFFVRAPSTDQIDLQPLEPLDLSTQHPSHLFPSVVVSNSSNAIRT